jgi:predicted ATPase/DNA-binding winged helix-turn-helix (wHTH) protein
LKAIPSTYDFGEFTLDVTRGCVLKAGEEIKVRPKVYEMLTFLVRNPGRLIGKQELIQAVWPDNFVTDDSLVQCTLELRRALDDRDQRLLRTVPRRGYLFTAEVTPVTPEALASEDAGFPGSTERRTSGAGRLGAKLIDLPIPRTALIGREAEVATAADLLRSTHVQLLSLTGIGGAGKTRLAIAVASAVASDFAGGIHFVGLASITDRELVATALAKSLDIQQVANRTAPQLISDYLQGSAPFLFVLDNFEQVLPAATLIAETLAACPTLKVLVTSRECLRIYGEQEFPVAPLRQVSAVQLFVQRATAVRPNFATSAENSDAIAEICSRLDGLPLAIELAAARTKLLSPRAILERLQSRLQLLTGGALDLPERQQTLRAAIDWSHDLLNEAEKKLFRRLSVFIGGCTLEAAEAVCNTGSDLGVGLFDGLASLVDKNLFQRVEGSDADARFTMLETIREYALEQLASSGEERATRRAHAAYCLVLAEEGNPELSPAERTAWLTRCDLEADNFRSAVDHLIGDGDVEWSLRLCMALFRFWDMRDHLIESRSRLEAVLRLAGDGFSKERAKVAQFLGALTTAQGDFTSAQRFLEQSLSLYQELGDRSGIAVSLNALAVSARDLGDYSSAQANFERSLACWRTLPNKSATARCLHNLANVTKVCGDYPRAQSALTEAASIFEELGDRSGAAWSKNQQGDIAREQGDVAAALGFYRRALSAFREIGDRWGSARSLADLGNVYCEQKDYRAAHASYSESLELFAELGHKRGIARALEGSACLAAARGDAARALKLAAAAAHLRRLISAPLPRAEQVRLDQNLLPAWKSLSDVDGKEAWAAGYALNMEGAIQHSLHEPPSTILH